VTLRSARVVTLLGCVWAATTASAAAPRAIKRLDGTTLSADALTGRIQDLVKKANVHGLALSIFNDRELVYSRAFGVKSTDTGDPLTTDTVFYGASLSKAVFGVLVMRLVEERVIDLDTPLVTYLDKPMETLEASSRKAWHEDLRALAADPRHLKITARMCLTHTTGLANWRWLEKDLKPRIHFEPGTRYSYSGEGLTFLQVVLERLTRRPLEDLMREKVFVPYGMTTSSYTWQPRFEENFCHGHDEKGKVLEKDKDNKARSASTLETTAADYARFTRAVLQREGLSKASWDELFKPQIRIRSKRQFGSAPWGPEETTTDNDDIALSYGLGWGLLESPHGRGAFKEGHGDGFEHYSIVFPDKGLGVAILTNSANGESIFKELLELTLADTFTPWEWQDYVPYSK
jgi:D-alanyl-D-alanine-carboxypeptidase/D-alanyl-D-alanine-endopeptidase